MADTPVRYLGDSDGKPQLQEFSTTDENYLAYQAGLRLAADSDIAALTLTSSGNRSVGSFSDTSFNQAIGTHGTTLTTATTTTNLYQKEGTASESGSSFRKPIHWQQTSGQTQLHEMTSSEIDSLTDRLVSRIFTSDYPGVFRLGTSSPSGDYSVYMSDVFSDTRTDGTDISYNIYRRTTMPAPTERKPLAIKRSLGATGTYQGLQEMSASQMQYTFGQRAKTRVMAGNNGVGSYLLLSATDGTPNANGYSGTWVAKGTATDTKQTTLATDYTRISTRTSSRNFTRVRPSTYQRTRTSNYAGNYSRNFTRNRGSSYTRDRSSNYSRFFARNYAGNYTRERSSAYTRDRSSNYAGNYIGEADYTRTRTSTYAGNYVSSTTQTFEGNYARNYTRSYARAFTRVRPISYTGDYTGVGNTASFTRNYTGNYTREVTYTGGTVGPEQYSVGPLPGYYWLWNSSQGTITILWNGTSQFNGPVTGGATVTKIGPSFGTPTNDGNNYTRGTFQSTTYGIYFYAVSQGAETDYVGTATYTRSEVGFVGNYTGDYVGGGGALTPLYYNRSGPSGTWTFYAEEYLGGDPDPYYVYIYWNQSSPTVQGQFGTIHDGYTYQRGSLQETFFSKIGSTEYYSVRRQLTETSYTGTYARTRTSTYTRIANWTRIRNSSFEGNYTRNYTRSFARNFTRNRVSTYTGNFTRDFSRNFVGNYIGDKFDYVGDYTRTFQGNYNRNITDTYVGNYSRNFSREFARIFTGNYSRIFTGNYSGEFVGDYTRGFQGNYSRDFQGNYSRNYAGNFQGNYVSPEIQAASQTINTYTLYVRTA